MDAEIRHVPWCDIYGNPIMTYGSIENIRKEDKDKKLKNVIYAQKGGQENMLASSAKIVVFGSARGPGKSFGALLGCLYDIKNPNFTALVLRNEKTDLNGLIEKSRLIFNDYGVYIASERSMRWDLSTGGKIYFSYHADDLQSFMVRFQGQERCYVIVDEATHVSEFAKVLYLMSILRNSQGIRCHMLLTCNPDSRSYLKTLVSWYLGTKETVYSDGLRHPERAGYPIPERDGKRRYVYFAGGDNLSEAVWGDSADEVYQKCRDRIDRLWKPEMAEYGDPKDLFIHSIEFYGAKITDNIKLMESDPSYLANLANASEEMIQRDLEGNWDWEDFGTDTLSVGDMNRWFDVSPQWDDNVLRAAQDVAFAGGDMAVTVLARGKHIVDIDFCSLDAKTLLDHTRHLLDEWGVNEENFTYDSNGIGNMYKGFFRRAIPFNSLERPWARNEREAETITRDFDTLKSQTAFSLADAIKYGEVSISDHVLTKHVSGRNYENISIKDMLLQERRFFNADESKAERGKGKCLYSKPDIKKWLHRSPDCTEAIVMLWSMFVKTRRPQSHRPSGTASFVQHKGAMIGNMTARQARRRTRYI